MFPTKSRGDTRYGRGGWLPVAVLLGGLLLVYYLLPLLSLLVAEPPGAVLERLGQPSVLSAATTSLATASTSAAIATGLGVPLAYWLARTDSRLGPMLTALVVLPLVVPPIVSGMLLLTVVGPNTIIGSLAASNGIALTRSSIGVVLAQTFVASPFVVVTAKAAFQSVDSDLEQASRSLGKTHLETIRKVTIPLAWPGILAGITLAFARSMGEFGATIMLAFYPRTMPVEIWVSYTSRGLEAAFPIAVILVGISAIALIVLNALGTNPLE